jgi:2-dehydro-3-deoxy-D-gluconate 5-dehydrogenase
MQNADMFSLDGKSAIVTGGNKGIGKGIARALANRGANILIADIAFETTGEESATVVEIRRDFGAEVYSARVDVRLEEDNKMMVREALDRFGRIDILVCNAGIPSGGVTPEEMPVSKWDDIMNTNLRSFFLAAKEVRPVMAKAGGGKIISIGSMLSVMGVGPFAVYGASKGGVLQLTRGLASGWAKYGIQVNCIMPGWINTELSINAKANDPELDRRVRVRTPAGRWGETDDIAGCAVFLASHASDFITGAAIPVDGGYSIQG